MLLRFEHIQFTCSNMDATLHFYCDLIGFKLIVRKTMDNGGQIAFIECASGSQLEIVQPAEAAVTPVKAIPRLQVGIKHFSLTVDSVDKTYEELSQKGVKFATVPRAATYQVLIKKLCVAEDPDGIHVEFNEPADGRKIGRVP